MQLNRLKYWRETRGLSLRELAEKSKIPYSAISLLENGKREPQGRTVHKLAQALGVEISELSELARAPAASNDNKTVTRASVRKSNQPAPVSYWVYEKDQNESDPFRLDTQAQAERLKDKLGGQHQARIYEAASRSDANKQHIQFLIRVTRGHDYW